jgi:two-component system, chemotaxis family, response regulator Rcp1
MPPEEFHILLVEDTQTDVLILQRALRESKTAHRLTVISNGRQALDYLLALNLPGCNAELAPDLILLDLDLPGLDGCQLLARIKNDPALRVLPVIVLTTSPRDEDVLRTYHAGANTYFQKPTEFARYRDLVNTLRCYWFEMAQRAPRLHG